MLLWWNHKHKRWWLKDDGQTELDTTFLSGITRQKSPGSLRSKEQMKKVGREYDISFGLGPEVKA